MTGKRPALVACVMFALVQFMPAFLTVPSSGDRLPASAVARPNAVTARPTMVPEQRKSTAAALAAAACVVALVARGGARRQSAPAVTLKAAASDPVPAASFTFTGATGKQPTGEERGASNIPRHLLMPKNIRWRKPHKPIVRPLGRKGPANQANDWKYRGEANGKPIPYFGKYGIVAKSEYWIVPKMIETCRRMAVRSMRDDGGKVWIKVFPHQGRTKRAAESRMGGGKGMLDSWCAAVKPGFVMFEFDGCEKEIALKVAWKMSRYLPFKTAFVERTKEDGPSQFELGLAGSLQKKRTIPSEFQPDVEKIKKK
eukprot:CAMPEP_0197651936 /NCGR_PEP_ID=MMETSP1338-20131121/34146_1 /TAXON_ID=43686 ORGANISM="Pelagodinium beii, Strain RCC1491" /NCGR_SAMPLE_ID=MMETSP1338 /ASSEMBLY_ACC=CAM_ASM_000754 /LENGTH=312 /DNA_ID=CAMNT_0043226705 /DNA_START=83 /DNA_END=1021 /DNA_ORIENTATION=-